MTILVFSMAPAAFAGDASSYVWTPSKTGDNAYKLRMGFKSPGGWDASAGPEVSVSASESGRVARDGASAGFWGTLSRKLGIGTGRTTTENVNVTFSATSGAGNVGVSRSRKVVVTPQVDFETQRTLTMQCNAYENHCSRPAFSQTARMSAVSTNTAVVAQGGVDATGSAAFNRLGVEQTFGDLTLGASVNDVVRQPRGVFSARYALNW